MSEFNPQVKLLAGDLRTAKFGMTWYEHLAVESLEFLCCLFGQ